MTDRAAVSSASVGISTTSYVAVQPCGDAPRCATAARWPAAAGADCARRAAPGPGSGCRAWLRSKLGPNIAPSAAHDREGQERPVQQEVVLEVGRAPGCRSRSTRWPSSSSSAAVLSVSSRTSGLASRRTDWVHTAMRSRCLPGRVTSPIGGSFGLRYARSASRKNAAVSRTDRVSTPLATRCSGIWRPARRAAADRASA